MNKKLCLGTAKLGMPDYGYSGDNTLKDPEIFIRESLRLGIDCIDTSPRYGNSEDIIGEVLKNTSTKPSINTKIDNLEANSNKNPILMKDSISRSIAKLNVDSIDVCYLHQNDINIISDKFVHEGIHLLKRDKLIKEIGTSIYSKEELFYTLESGLFDWVQVPMNILDTSFYHTICNYGTNIKVAARSLFLQGILLDHESILDDISDNSELLNLLEYVNEICSNNGLNVIELTLSYISFLDRVDQIIIGTTSIVKLRDNILFTKIELKKKIISIINSISRNNKSWTNPRLWRKYEPAKSYITRIS
jgi:uncharacterized protein